VDHRASLGAERGAFDTAEVPPRTPRPLAGRESHRTTLMEGIEMATTWELMAVCIEDAARAEDLVSELAFRRELRLDPQNALAAFELHKTRPER
jgi:hypothetical protein